MQIVDVTKEEECCCSCKHNIRKQDEKMAGIYCECDIDNHYIGYVACFESVCERWERRMKKVFISQPMNGLTDLQISKDRARVVEGLYNDGYSPDEITIIDTFIDELAPDNVNSALWYLGKSLELLADADIAVFAKGWRNARGCQIEFKCAKEYGISYICED